MDTVMFYVISLVALTVWSFVGRQNPMAYVSLVFYAHKGTMSQPC